MSLTDIEWASLERGCAAVPPVSRPPAIGTDRDYPDFVENLLLTVLDLRLQNIIVNNAILYFRDHRRADVRTIDDLEAVLGRFPDDPDGNRNAARYLWRYGYGDRLASLRGLVRWVRQRGLIDQARLRRWAYASRRPPDDFAADFAGQVRGLGIAAYCWLMMRLGVDTVKPDVMLHRFVTRALGRDLDDVELVRVINEAAARVGRRARELDAGIWEQERGGPGTI